MSRPVVWPVEASRWGEAKTMLSAVLHTMKPEPCATKWTAGSVCPTFSSKASGSCPKPLLILGCLFGAGFCAGVVAVLLETAGLAGAALVGVVALGPTRTGAEVGETARDGAAVVL